jgi:predicted short-subunit dehydrogenase-like oxidoreductase (DUF2520 family)
VTRLRIIGPGRAGKSLAMACAVVEGCDVVEILGRGNVVARAAVGVDVLVIATPDEAIGRVAAAVDPVSNTIVAHLSGSLSLDVLAPHLRRASLHPLASLPNAELGSRRLLDRCPMAVSGDLGIRAVAEAFGAEMFEIADSDRAKYHAAACVASNHLSVLCAQVERLAEQIGVPPEAMWKLMEGVFDSVRSVGAVASLTGPAARGDIATVEAHLAAIPPDERELYEVMSRGASRLAGHG